VLIGQTKCSQCSSLGIECRIIHDDERRKPNSKAYISSLTERIDQLEKLLREKDERENPATGRRQSRSGSRNGSHDADGGGGRPDLSTLKEPTTRNPPSVASNYGSDHLQPELDVDAVSPQSNSSIASTSMVSKLLSTTGHLSFDQLNGRLRYFGPVANCHVHSELRFQSENANRQALEQQRRGEKAIRSISLDTHDYLMDLFWNFYNSVLHVVHQAAFEEGREAGQGPYYSTYLHICILAMGYRFADKTRPDMIRIALPDMENTLHREAKYMLEYEIEQSGGIPSIIALLLLGDLEAGVGRDNLGWLYAGMANRLCFENGLHLDNSGTGATQRDIEIGRLTLWSCIVYDKYWALFLGRPTMMKAGDLEVYKLSVEFERLGTSLPAGPEKSRETQIYEALLDLMELAGKITEIMDQPSKLSTNIDHHIYFRMSSLHKEIESWYSRLPKSLQWTADNIATSPFSFFLLHQQYSATMILLHRPFARYDDPNSVQANNSDSSEDDSDTGKIANPTNHFSALSRTICTQHAVRIARIFWQHRQRFDTRQIFVTGLQHAGTAATALVAALAFMKDRSTRNNNMQYLECLTAALKDMSYTYVPAQRMSNVLEAVALELRDAAPERRTVPARRDSSHRDSEERPGAFKRHQSFHKEYPSRIPEEQPFHIPFQPQKQSKHQARDVNHRHSGGTPVSQTSMTNSSLSHSLPGDGWTIVPPEKQIPQWPPLSQDLSSFDQMSHGERSPNTNTFTQPSFFPNSTQPPNSNFTQYRSINNAWMGAETPRTAFSPPPAGGVQTPPLFQNQRIHLTAAQRAGLSEFQDLTSTDFVSLLNPDDRLDFGNLGMPSSMGLGGLNQNSFMGQNGGLRDLDGYSPMLGKNGSSGDGEPRASTAGSGGAMERLSGVTGSEDPTHSGTVASMAGLADMMRRRG
jgi:hypothetical protein